MEVYQEVRRVGGIQRWPEVKEKKVKMSSKKRPLGLAKKRSLGRLGTESEVGAGHRRWPGGETGEKRRPHSKFSPEGRGAKGCEGFFQMEGVGYYL